MSSRNLTLSLQLLSYLSRRRQSFERNSRKVSEVVLPWLMVKKTLPLLERAAMMLIYGSLRALDTNILFLA